MSWPSTRAVPPSGASSVASIRIVGGLAGAVGAEHAVDRAAADGEVDAVDGADVAEGLHQARGLDREVSGHRRVVTPVGRKTHRALIESTRRTVQQRHNRELVVGRFAGRVIRRSIAADVEPGRCSSTRSWIARSPRLREARPRRLRRRMPGWPADPPRMDGQGRARHRRRVRDRPRRRTGLRGARRDGARGRPQRAARAGRRAGAVGGDVPRPRLRRVERRRACASWPRASSGVDVLVNNAGVMPPERTRSVDGVELTFATHVLAPFVLIGLAPVCGRRLGARDQRHLRRDVRAGAAPGRPACPSATSTTRRPSTPAPSAPRW